MTKDIISSQILSISFVFVIFLIHKIVFKKKKLVNFILQTDRLFFFLAEIILIAPLVFLLKNYLLIPAGVLLVGHVQKLIRAMSLKENYKGLSEILFLKNLTEILLIIFLFLFCYSYLSGSLKYLLILLTYFILFIMNGALDKNVMIHNQRDQALKNSKNFQQYFLSIFPNIFFISLVSISMLGLTWWFSIVLSLLLAWAISLLLQRSIKNTRRLLSSQLQFNFNIYIVICIWITYAAT